MEFLSKLFTRFFHAKKVFKLPKKNKLIILDSTGANKIKDNILGHDNFTILESKKDVINIPIAFLSVFFIIKHKKYAYEACFINYVNAKLALTWIDTSYFYCDIFKNISYCKLAFIQNGRISNLRFDSSQNDKYKLDYYFLTGDGVKSLLKKHIEAKFISAGSPIANNFNVALHKPIQKIQWIGQYKNPNLTNVNFQNWFHKPIEYALKTVSGFCKIHNLKLEVLGRTNLPEEYNFYNMFLDNFTFKGNDINKFPYNQYHNLSNNAIICGHDSNLIYEAFSLQYRTAFFSFRGFYAGNISYGFGWPNVKKEAGLFWTNVPDKEKIFEVFLYLKNVSSQDWLRQVENYKNVITRDPSNIKIKEILKKVNIEFSHRID